jgi:hypothetical protein
VATAAAGHRDCHPGRRVAATRDGLTSYFFILNQVFKIKFKSSLKSLSSKLNQNAHCLASCDTWHCQAWVN